MWISNIFVHADFSHVIDKSKYKYAEEKDNQRRRRRKKKWYSFFVCLFVQLLLLLYLVAVAVVLTNPSMRWFDLMETVQERGGATALLGTFAHISRVRNRCWEEKKKLFCIEVHSSAVSLTHTQRAISANTKPVIIQSVTRCVWPPWYVFSHR